MDDNKFGPASHKWNINNVYWYKAIHCESFLLDWLVLHQIQVSKAGTSNYIAQMIKLSYFAQNI